jgi:hypothetical protein
MGTDIAVRFVVWDGWINKALGDIGLTIGESKNYEWIRFNKRMHERANNGAAETAITSPGFQELPCGFGQPYGLIILIRLRHQQIEGTSITQKDQWNRQSFPLK